MSSLAIPNSFSPNTVALSALVNANFTAIVNWSTTIDNSNIGSAGIFASQILPLTGAEATFGATATGVGYKFLANDATAVPLTVSGVTSQSADIFDVTLTSGGTKAFGVSALGHTLFGAIGTTGDASSAYIAGDLGATIGLAFNVPTSSTNGYKWFVNGATQLMQLTAAGALTAASTVTAPNFLMTSSVATTANILNDGTNSLYRSYGTSGYHAFSNAAGTTLYFEASGTSAFATSVLASTGLGTLGYNFAASNGDIIAQRTAGTGTVWMGGSTSAGYIDWNQDVSNSFAIRYYNGSSYAYALVSGGTYTPASDARLKENVEDVPYGLATVLAMQPRRFDWINDKRKDLGFIAQEIEQLVPEVVHVDNDGYRLMNYDGLLSVIVKAIQELASKQTSHSSASA